MTTVHNLTQIGRAVCLLLAALIVTSSLSMGAIGAHVAFETQSRRSRSNHAITFDISAVPDLNC